MRHIRVLTSLLVLMTVQGFASTAWAQGTFDEWLRQRAAGLAQRRLADEQMDRQKNSEAPSLAKGTALVDQTESPDVLGLAMSAGAVATATFGPAWPVAAVVAVALAFGLTAVGWNGVYIAEVARIVPAHSAAAATGAAFAMTYAGIVVMPLLFWVIVDLTGSYAAAYAAAGGLALWRGARLLTRGEPAAAA